VNSPVYSEIDNADGKLWRRNRRGTDGRYRRESRPDGPSPDGQRQSSTRPNGDGGPE